MRGPSRLVLGCALVAALLTSGLPSVSAQDAQALLRAGVEARRHGDDARALALFTEAQAATPSGVALAQMGLAAQALGRWVEAEAHLTAALAAEDSFVTRNRTTLEEALATVRQNLGRLELWSEVAGGSVEINGQSVGTLPLEGPVSVLVGSAVVVVRLEGHHTFERTIQIRAGSTTREEVRLVAITRDPPVVEPTPEPVVEPPATPETHEDAPAVVAPALPAVAAEEATDEPRPATQPSHDGGLLGGGVAWTVLALVGAGLSIGFAIALDTANSFYGGSECQGIDRTRICPRTHEAIGINEAGLIGSVIGAGSSLALAVAFFVAFGNSSSGDETELACGAGPGELGLSCGVAF